MVEYLYGSVQKYMGNKLILFGQEKYFSKFVWHNDQDTITGVSNPDFRSANEQICYDSQGQLSYQGLAMSPQAILAADFDYIVIIDHEIVHRAYGLLTQLGIPAYRIVTYEYYTGNLQGRSFYSSECEGEIISSLVKLQVKEVLDYDTFFAHGSQFVRSDEHFHDLRLYAYAPQRNEEGLFKIYDNLYEKIYTSENDFNLRMFEAIVFTEYREINEIISLIKAFNNCAKYLIFRFRSGSEALRQMSNCRFAGALPQWRSCLNGELCVLNINRDESVKVRVVMHKPVRLPLLDDAYYPVHGGRKLGRDMGIEGDDTGNSISELNPFLNELTVLYWMWKNDASEITGLVHYRRYFLKQQTDDSEAEKNILDKASIREILRGHDIILGTKHFYGLSYGNAMNILWCLNVNLYEASLPVIRKWLCLRQPEYERAFDFVMNHQGFYRCNMFITRKKVRDAYAEWLFSFILDAVRDFNYEGLSDSEKRIMGYWGEILINVWLVRQNLRIKELPIWQC